jgi:GMP synthase (glutamine-hydrolysing) A subunit
MKNQKATDFESILILDFGSQYTHLIARRIREFGVYSELFACTTQIKDIPFKPKGVILSGGPYSVYEKGSPHVDPAVWDLNVPVLGICYGLQVCFVFLVINAFIRKSHIQEAEKSKHATRKSLVMLPFPSRPNLPFSRELTRRYLYG